MEPTADHRRRPGAAGTRKRRREPLQQRHRGVHAAEEGQPSRRAPDVGLSLRQAELLPQVRQRRPPRLLELLVRGQRRGARVAVEGAGHKEAGPPPRAPTPPLPRHLDELAVRPQHGTRLLLVDPSLAQLGVADGTRRPRRLRLLRLASCRARQRAGPAPHVLPEGHRPLERSGVSLPAPGARPGDHGLQCRLQAPLASDSQIGGAGGEVALAARGALLRAASSDEDKELLPGPGLRVPNRAPDGLLRRRLPLHDRLRHSLQPMSSDMTFPIINIYKTGGQGVHSKGISPN
uniref:Uncharacterized protein n=1 Tax=Steinernema glaseri TaxID=37863 RepID=A0A1I7ZNU3_9BILA